MNDKLLKLWNDPRRMPLVIGLVAFNAGVALGYFLGKRAWVKSEAEFVSEDMKDVLTVDELKTLRDIQKPNSIDTAKRRFPKEPEQIIEIVKEDVPDTELVTRSIFDHHEDWNYDLESKKRSETEPYVLHKDEFFGEENDYKQITATYYAGDDILVDEDDTPIYNHNQVVGPMLFGHGSGDPNVFYVRNDKRKTEYEVVYDKGLYSVEVLGLEIEDNKRVEDLRHSRVPKFRKE